MRIAILIAALSLSACGHPQTASAVQTRVVTTTVEIQRPCPVTVPARPSPLAIPLPTDALQLAALIGAKLAQWSGPGGYGERADAALRKCVAP